METTNRELYHIRRPSFFSIAIEASTAMVVVDGFFALAYGSDRFFDYLPLAGLPFVLLASGRIITLTILLVRDVSWLHLSSETQTDLIPIRKD